MAEGQKQSIVLKAEGEAAAIQLQAEASAQAVRTLASAIETSGGTQAVSMKIAEQYVQAFGQVAKESTTVLLPANTQEPSSMVASAMSIFTKLQDAKGGSNLPKASNT